MPDVFQYRECRATITARIPDTPDADAHPDRVLVQGRGTAHPQFQGGSVVFPEIGEYAIPQPIPVVIVDGELLVEVLAGDESVETQPLFLPVTVDERANQNWSWRLVFDFLTLGEYGEEVKHPPLSFPVEAGDEPLEISTVATPVIKSQGFVTRGAPGPGLQEITAEDGEIVFQWDNGRSISVQVPDAVPGPPGDTGPPPYLATGETTVTDDPDEAALTISGATPNYRVDAVLPRGPRGLPGDTGPAPYLATGTTTVTDDPGEAALTIRGATPNYLVDVVLPRGPRGEKGEGAVPVTVAATPEYTTASAHTWEPTLSLYNGDSEAMRVVRQLIRRGLQGERVRMVCAGPSTVAGTGGAEPMVAVSSWPAQLGDLLGVSPGRVMASQYDNRWTLGTGIAGRTATNTLGAQSSGDFTATYTSREPATGYTLYAYRQSTTDLTITVDGGSPQAISLPGLSSFKALRIDGLADTTHTITISGPDGVFIDSIEADTDGLTIHNAGRPSSSASDWVSGDTSSTWSQVFPTTFVSEAGNADQPKPDLALVQPLLNGSQPADIRQVVANVQALNIPTVLVTCGGVGGLTGGSTVPTQIAALYDAADEFDLPLIDLTDTMGWYASASAKGLMDDTVHPNRRGYSVQAWRIYRALIGA